MNEGRKEAQGSGQMMECVLVDPYHFINFTKKILFSFKRMLEVEEFTLNQTFNLLHNTLCLAGSDFQRLLVI